ncbi:MAG TPA: hypothetical protein VFH36_03530 [Acidimicrobiales bacterium]|jgi:hypothetical protein|nr:hypothetical protein [Acidimicrobiales bacterium]
MAQPTIGNNSTDTDVDRISEALAQVFRTADVGDVFTDDVFLDGHPPYWRFQLEGIEDFRAWLQGYAAGGREVEVVRTIATPSGFVTEHTEAMHKERELITGRQLILCEVRDGRISELTVFCSGEWDATLRARHAAEAPILRP